ncbi:2Fe-2S iron-sulfur cluster-binding protein [Paracoccus sp. IB05]|uniref:2Fe-2S iron-sulfur cluster-binding protein n=1 Tax=Paracoccus sp. IB05 TaxID=2779367 RepID=UPI0018E6F9FE|nr:2Fe-2S iron-sulfur cluster-binding protein [Paracoccus sp. IB05]MBJ2149698.1 2Fe-2S iron-sulfur cluster binding domain-containing protein [Paracoccus sp. IB05]
MAGDAIRITFADGEPVEFLPLPGDSVLVAAEKAGVKLASNCRAGTCGTCHATGPGGAETALCVTPCAPGQEFALSYNRADLVPASLRRAKINSFSRISAGVWEIRYRMQFPLPFLPGQYVDFTFPGIDDPRHFSMSNPEGQGEQVIHVRDLPGGAMAEFLETRARPELAFSLRGPFGIFYLRRNPRPKLFVTGGTGLAPVLSMLSSLTAETAAPMILIAGFSREADVYGRAQLSDLAARLPLRVIFACSRAAPGFDGVAQNPVRLLEDPEIAGFAAGAEAYLCGAPAMVTAIRARLQEIGTDMRAVYHEEFSHVVPV